jgi:class 3 adenylate cyclase/energy-coupling factor transporter ATP-binding protein EcfA2
MSTDTSHYPEERRLATVLFADVQGFTALAEQLDFELVNDLLNGIWQRLDKVIERHNGYIDKHLGDAVMGVWGAPFAGEKDAEMGVAAGLELIKALNDYCHSTTIPGAETLKLRVGINTGLVFAGYVGTRHEYTVLGDIVNVANRLEQIAEAGTVVIGENTLRLVRGNFRVKRLDPIKVKGKTELVQPYAVEGQLASQGRIHYQSADSLVTNMVGRDEELARLKTLYHRAFESPKNQMVLIDGELGIGKSRLMMEFGNLLENSGENVNIISSRGLAQASKVPFYLWRALIRNRFELRDEDPTPAIIEKWTQSIDELWRNDPQDSKLEVIQILGEIIGLSDQASLTNNDRLKRVFFLIRELLRRLSQQKRLILFFDDLQWSDRESLHLLALMLETEEAPFQALIVGAARPEFLKSQTHWRNLSRVISLPPLTLNPEMVRMAYPDLQSVRDTVLHDIAIHAEGNPYFLEEIVKSLIKGHLLENNIETQQVLNRLLAQIPESLRGTLQARMDGLSREARTVALLASIVGRVFWVGAVLAAARSIPLPGSTPMINIPEPVIDRFIQDGLRQLVRAELAFPRSGSKFSEEQEYIFKNSYLRDVAYGLIPNRNRAQYHKAVAEWMKQKPDPAYQAMAHEHERSAALAAKTSTGSLSPIYGEK